MVDDTPVWPTTGRSTGFGRELARAAPGLACGRLDRLRADLDARAPRSAPTIPNTGKRGEAATRRLAGAALALLGTAVAAAAAPAWPDDATSRLEALALVETLNADLLGHDSATLTLERWCGTHGLAASPTVTARRVPEAETPADAGVRGLLGVGADEPVRHRHVRLACGGHVLSEADNYYLPARLTPEMNRVLDAGDTAFGRAVAALRFVRRTLSAELLWHPLPPGWERGAALPAPAPGGLAVPAELLRHRAVLTLPDGTPFSALVETYTGEVLAFPEPPPR